MLFQDSTTTLQIFFVIIIKCYMVISIIIVVAVCHASITSPILKLLHAILKNYHVAIRKCVSSLYQVDVMRTGLTQLLPFCTRLRRQQSKLHKINGS